MRWVGRFGTCAVLAAAVGCSDQICFDDRTCGEGQRCVYPRSQRSGGMCEPCALDEVPYDGVDNDCRSMTRDFDLDADGDNARDVELRPGTDCDDGDPEVFGGPNAREVCGDGKDNDCDGRTDEADCGDVVPPVVNVLEPTNGARVSETTFVIATFSDDAGLAEVAVSLLGVQLIERRSLSGTTGSYETVFDSRRFEDGQQILSLQATDVAGRRTTVNVPFVIDNLSGPSIMLRDLASGQSVAGQLFLDARATDPDGVVAMNIDFDGREVATSTRGDLAAVVTASTAEETIHLLSVSATDGLGNAARSNWAFRVDRTPPQIVFLEPAAGTSLREAVEVVVRATDPAGVASLSSLGRSVTGGPGTTTLELRYTFDPSQAPSGLPGIGATAVDATRLNGGPGNTVTATLSVDLPD